MRVGAMSVEHFIEHLVDGSLVVVPSDRPDILVATLASSCHPRSRRSPASCSRARTRSAIRCVPCSRARPSRCSRRQQPVHVAAAAVQSMRPLLRADDERKIAAALGLFEAAVDMAELDRRIALERARAA